MFFAIYNINTGVISSTVSAPYYMPELFNLDEGFAVLEVDRQPDDGNEHIKDGVLSEKPKPINDPYRLYDDVSTWSEEAGAWVSDTALLAEKKIRNQADMWEAIKSKRLEHIMNGVLVESTGKVFHTDNLSVIQYSTIAGMASLGTYQPTPWKVMDNSWVMLTVELLKELQVAMSIKTNENYKVAEQHKAAMLLVDNPLEYDYSAGWV